MRRNSPPKHRHDGTSPLPLGMDGSPPAKNWRTLQNEKQHWAHAKSAKKKLLHECGVLRHHLQECSVDFPSEDEDKVIFDLSTSDALDLLTTSDNKIGLFLAEGQLLEQNAEHAIDGVGKTWSSEPSENLVTINGDDLIGSDEELRKMLADTLIDNVTLRKQVNSTIRCVLKPEKDFSNDVPSRTVLNRYTEK